jgi:hypothetical protein
MIIPPFSPIGMSNAGSLVMLFLYVAMVVLIVVTL